MKELIGHCGFMCHLCPAFLASQTENNEIKEQIASSWTEKFKIDFKPEDIECDGCTTTEGRFFGNWKRCKIRVCSTGKKIVNCAYCEEYSCDKLERIFKAMPETKARLDRIKQKFNP